MTGAQYAALAHQYQAQALAAQKAYGVPAQLLLAIAGHETSGINNTSNPSAAGYGNGGGLMQLEPGTASTYLQGAIGDPQANINAGAAYLKSLHTLYGSWWLATAAYYAGPGTLAKHGVGRGTAQSVAAKRLAIVPNPAANTQTITSFANQMVGGHTMSSTTSSAGGGSTTKSSGTSTTTLSSLAGSPMIGLVAIILGIGAGIIALTRLN